VPFLHSAVLLFLRRMLYIIHIIAGLVDYCFERLHLFTYLHPLDPSVTVAYYSRSWSGYHTVSESCGRGSRPDDVPTTYHEAHRHGWRAADIDIGY